MEHELELSWTEEERTLCLGGEAVLQLRMRWPQVRGAGGVGRYYRKLREVWLAHYLREGYVRAALEVVGRRAEGQPVRPWQVELDGEVTLQTEELVSIRVTAREIRGDGRMLEVKRGDVWTLPDGVPRPLRKTWPRGRRALLAGLRECAGQRRGAGDCCLDGNAEGRLSKVFSPHNYCLTGERLEVYFPQCAIAPAAEGAVALWVALEGGRKEKMKN